MREDGYPDIWRKFLIMLRRLVAVFMEFQPRTLPQLTRWFANYKQLFRLPASSGRHCKTTYHAWRTSFSSLRVHSWAVSLYKAAPRLGTLMSATSNLERMKTQTLGRVKHFEWRAMVESIRCRPWDQVFAKLIQKVCISRYFESPETDCHIAENASCIDYADTWSSKQVQWLSRSQSPHRITSSRYGSEAMLELDAAVAQACLPITWIHAGVASEPTIQLLPATPHHTGWVNNFQECHGGFRAIPVLDPVDVKTAYLYSSSPHHCLQWHVQSHGWPDGSLGQEEYTMERRLIPLCEVCAAEAPQILYRSDYNNWYAGCFGPYPWSFPEVPIVSEVAHGNGY